MKLIDEKVQVSNIFSAKPYLSEKERRDYPFVYTEEMKQNEGKIGTIVKVDEENKRLLICFENGLFWYPEDSFRMLEDVIPIHLLKMNKKSVYFDNSLKDGNVMVPDVNEAIKGTEENLLHITSNGVKTKYGFEHSYIISGELPLNKKLKGTRYFKIFQRIWE